MILSSKQIFGLDIEQYIINNIGDCFQPSSFLTRYDAIKEGVLIIEVKASKPHRQRVKKSYWRYRYEFDLSRFDNPHALVILVCVCPDGLHSFYVPGYLLVSRQHVSITSHPLSYKGWISKYLERMIEIDNMIYIAKLFDDRFLQFQFDYI